MIGPWRFEDIDWSLFDAAKVNPDLLQLMKTAGVVERNGSDYGTYLTNVFAGDTLLQKEIKVWAEEEVKHGQTLATWVKLADPQYNFDKCFQSYIERFPIPVDSTESIRGSRGSELLARCMVEIGTSFFYTSIKERTDEPLLKQICAKIAADELRHYKLFYTHFQRYQEKEHLNLYQRFKVGLGRMFESNSDELATAYHTANELQEPYDRKYHTKRYESMVYKYYNIAHVKRSMAMFCKAVGVNPQGWVHKCLSFMAMKVLSFKTAK
jgi:hypothetical protein